MNLKTFFNSACIIKVHLGRKYFRLFKFLQVNQSSLLMVLVFQIVLVKTRTRNIYNSLHRFLVSLELIYKIFTLADYSGVEIKHGMKFLASYKSFSVLRSKISNGNVPIFNWHIT